MTVSCAAVVKLAVMRCAITFRRPVSGIRRKTDRPGAVGSATVLHAAAFSTAACTSASLIRPPGPVPTSAARSMPCCAASLRASGLALTSPTGLLARGETRTDGASDATSAAVIASAPALPCRASLTSRTRPSTPLTGTISPAEATCSTRPSAGETISVVAFSFSISSTTSPAFTPAPAGTSQRARVPSIIYMPI